MTDARKELLKGWGQTLAIIVTIAIAVWQGSLASDRRLTSLEVIVKNHEARLAEAEKTLQIAVQSQARITAIEEMWIKRHEQEDNRRFAQVGVK